MLSLARLLSTCKKKKLNLSKEVLSFNSEHRAKGERARPSHRFGCSGRRRVGRRNLPAPALICSLGLSLLRVFEMVPRPGCLPRPPSRRRMGGLLVEQQLADAILSPGCEGSGAAAPSFLRLAAGPPAAPPEPQQVIHSCPGSWVDNGGWHRHGSTHSGCTEDIPRVNTDSVYGSSFLHLLPNTLSR